MDPPRACVRCILCEERNINQTIHPSLMEESVVMENPEDIRKEELMLAFVLSLIVTAICFLVILQWLGSILAWGRHGISVIRTPTAVETFMVAIVGIIGIMFFVLMLYFAWLI